MYNLILGFCFASVCALLLLHKYGVEVDPCTTYNEMRQIHIETNGEYGWPEGAVKECEDDKHGI